MKNRKINDRLAARSRRNFLMGVGGAAALSTVGASIADSPAAELPELEETDATAVALRYVHDASTLDATIRKNDSAYCYNCALFLGKEDDEWAGCSIFPGKAVAGRGWCSVWAPK